MSGMGVCLARERASSLAWFGRAESVTRGRSRERERERKAVGGWRSSSLWARGWRGGGRRVSSRRVLVLMIESVTLST